MSKSTNGSNGWPIVTLGDAIERIETGVSPKTLDRPVSNGEMGVLKVSAVTWGTFRPEENKALPSDFDTAGIPTVGKGDLLLSRANTAELLASPVIADKHYPNLILSDKTLRLVPVHGVSDPRFLFYGLRQLEARRFFFLNATGTSGSMRNVSQATIRRCPIPLPPLSEQKRIADILDKADAIRRKRQDSRSYIHATIRSIYHDIFGQPVSNPKQWPVEKLSEVVAEDTTVSYGIVQCGEYVDGGVPYIRTSNMSNETLPPLEMFGRTHPDIAKKFKRSTVRTGDLVFANRATIGAVVAVPEYLEGANLTQGTARISPGSRHTTEFLLWTVRSKELQAWFDRWAKGVTFREITMGKLREAPIPVPPMELQTEFGKQVSKIYAIDSHIASASSESDDLFNSLVQRAFKGEL